uniref:Uncharacterized protein n=1 Tax=Rousettus aegyptiacus TaxID=9407 RepID=A0A7J8KAM7_ROUAE|nr:hypothetical protein HJG63_007809 [Rousettus aegyptiacus]
MISLSDSFPLSTVNDWRCDFRQALEYTRHISTCGPLHLLVLRAFAFGLEHSTPKYFHDPSFIPLIFLFMSPSQAFSSSLFSFITPFPPPSWLIFLHSTYHSLIYCILLNICLLFVSPCRNVSSVIIVIFVCLVQ